MKYKVGDKVKIKSLDWYNENKDNYGAVYAGNGFAFWNYMAGLCGEIMTISSIKVDPEDSNKGYYFMENSEEKWTDEMIEGLVEEETTLEPKFKKGDCVKCSDDSIGIIVDCDWVESKESYLYYIDYIGTLDAGYQLEKDLQPHTITTMNGRDIFEGAKWKHEFECPNGYIFKDENGNVINATKIVLENKKKEYPKTYEECAEIIAEFTGSDCNPKGCMGYMSAQLTALQKLLICRNAYWKLYGDEMGLGKPWEPDWLDDDTKKYVITSIKVFETFGGLGYINYILTFPTKEMRDAFYENFKELIEQCKEFL